MVRKIINVLLVGETGVGKTTFINILPSYLTDETLQQIASRDLMVLAPIAFTHINDNWEERTIQLGNDVNEISKPGASSTQKPRMYLYDIPSKNVTIQVIDTPGIGDTRGLERDQLNTQALLRYISELKELHAVCIFLKPDNSRFTILFEHCLRVILKELLANVRNNLVFVFTRTRGNQYTPGDTLSPLKETLNNIERETNSVIPFGKNNVFCIDNEAFRYLAAQKHGIRFNDDEIQRYTDSYNHSSEIVQRMVDYMTTLPAVQMQNVATPNESKRIILRLSKPLISLLMDYEKALVSIQEYEDTLQANISNLDLLKQNLFKIEHKRIVKEHSTYEHTRSHKFNLNIKASFPPFFISGSTDYNLNDDEHTYRTQDVDFVEEKTFDKDVYNMIKDETSARAAVQSKIFELNALCDEYKQEVVTVLGAIATFYTYCQENNIATSEDPCIRALQAAKEEAELDNKQVLAKEFDTMIKRYKIKKSAVSDVHPEDIKEQADALYKLKYSGAAFKQVMTAKFSFHTIQFSG